MIEPEPENNRQEWIRGRRKKRKVARVARIRRQLLRYTMLAGLVALGVSGFTRVNWYLQSVPDSIEVRNNKVASTKQIRDALAPYAGKPIYQLDPQKLEAQVNKLAAVKYSFVRRSLLPKPHLVVEVLEEFPWATLTPGPGMPPKAVIAQSGRLIPIKEFPAVIQPSLQFYGDAPAHMKEPDVAGWSNWINLISAQTACAVNSVDMRKATDITIQTGDLSLRVGPADSGLTRRLGRLGSVMPVLVDYRDRLEYIDLSLDNSVPLKVAKQPIKGRVYTPQPVDIGDVTNLQNSPTGEPAAVRVRRVSPLEPDSGVQLNENQIPSQSPDGSPGNDGRQTADSKPLPAPPI